MCLDCAGRGHGLFSKSISNEICAIEMLIASDKHFMGSDKGGQTKPDPTLYCSNLSPLNVSIFEAGLREGIA